MLMTLDNGETQMTKTYKSGWYVLYSGGSGIENAVHFSTRGEATVWATKYCSGTAHRIVHHKQR